MCLSFLDPVSQDVRHYLTCLAVTPLGSILNCSVIVDCVCVIYFTRRGLHVHTQTVESSSSCTLLIDERFSLQCSLLSISHDGHCFHFYYTESF